LIFSDIPNNRLMRYDEASGVVSTFREPSANANGNTVDRQGRLVTCEHLTRRVTRAEADGSVTVLADAFGGGRLDFAQRRRCGRRGPRLLHRPYVWY
jgi:gluconolactonase